MPFRLIPLILLPLLTLVAPVGGSTSATMWEQVDTPVWSIMVRSVERVPGSSVSEQLSGTYLAVVVADFTNPSQVSTQLDPNDVRLESSGGTAENLHESDITGAYARQSGYAQFSVSIPGESTETRMMLFRLPERSENLELIVVPADRTIALDECKCSLPSPVREVN